MMKPMLRTRLAQRTEDDHFRAVVQDGAPAQRLNPEPGSDNLPYSGAGGPTTIATTAPNGPPFSSATAAERLDGSVIVLWQDRTTPVGQEDVRGTVIAANGTVLVPSFNVSLAPAGYQADPEVAVRNADGAFLAAWISSQGAGTASIHSQLFDAAGGRVGAELELSLTSADDLQVVPLADGGFMIVWRVITNDEIRGQRLDASGAEVGGELVLIAVPTPGMDRILASAHQLPTGELALTVGEEINASEAPHTPPYVRTFDLAGNATDTETFGVDGYVQFVEYAPDGSSIALIRSSTTVTFQRFDADGEKIGGTVTLTPTLSQTQQVSGLIALPSGEYMIVWEGTAFSGTGNAIFGRTFSVDGVRTSPIFELVTSSQGLSIAEITAEDDGSIALTWNRGSNASGYTLLTQRFEPQPYPPSGTFTGTPNNDNLWGGTGDDIVNGLGASDRLYGGAGNDRLDGGTGADITDGGAGDDFHYVDNLGDVVVELAGEGYDNLQSSIDWVLAENVYVEVLSTTLNAGTGRIDLTGNSMANVIVGNDGKNVLDGKGGADILVGLGGDDFFVVDAEDRVYENVGGGYDNVGARASYTLLAGQEIEVLATADIDGAINLTGNEFGQVLVGNRGNNILDGRGGADIMQGLDGNDTYFVDDANDQVLEGPNGPNPGYDYVVARVSYVLAANVYVELMSTDNNAGTASINLTGNERINILIGNAGANILDSGQYGGDILQGLGGNDTYFVSGLDRVFEDAGGGFDYVIARTNFVLGAGASVELMSTDNNAGTTAINLTGNELAQVLVGNAGNNALNGGLGAADILQGLGGNDTYYVDGSDQVLEAAGGGSDYVIAVTSYVLAAGVSVELMSTDNNGGSAAIGLTGNELGQALVGNAGANILNGALGNDVLQGLGGADTFQFTTALGAGNVDTIVDFVSATDKIALDDATFTAIGAPGALNPNAFFAGAAAHDADDRIIYDSATGQLFYDADGNGAGAQVLFATLTGAPIVAASDFLVI
jgi:Ca2+-binding RTX toxin-like protein